jgi:hypothetical protein
LLYEVQKKDSYTNRSKVTLWVRLVSPLSDILNSLVDIGLIILNMWTTTMMERSTAPSWDRELLDCKVNKLILKHMITFLAEFLVHTSNPMNQFP